MSLDNIFTTGSHLGCTYHVSFAAAKEMLDLLYTSFGFPSLAIINIGVHVKNPRTLAYWLSKEKKKREVSLTEVT